MSSDLSGEMTGTSRLAELLRFLIVGGVFALGFAIASAILVQLGVPPYAAAVGVYVVTVPLAFLTHRRVTFRVAQTRSTAFPIYVATQVASVTGVSWITTRFVTGDMVLDTLIFLATAGATAGVSFLICKSLAFRPA